jgi:predicted anti-sigma-YlaC factor YlaD
MSDLERDIPAPCVATRKAIHETFDGHMASERRAGLERHLAECEACAAFRDELARVETALRELPVVAMPEGALETVWDRTVRAERSGIRFLPRARIRRALAAALAAVAAVAAWMAHRAAESGPSPDEIRLARVQLERVLEITGSALGRTRNAALDRVFRREVAPVLRRIPILGSGAAEPAPRRKES